MPAAEIEKLRRNARRRDELLAERDELIRAARAAGASVIEIAAAADLSRVHVYRVLDAVTGTANEPGHP